MYGKFLSQSNGRVFLRSFDSSLKVFSAGTFPSKNVHPIAIQVMSEIDIDLHDARPKMLMNF